MSGWTVNPVGPVSLIALAAVVMLGLVFVVPANRPLTLRQRATLAILRALVAVIITAALLRPEQVFTEIRQRRASVMLLIDASRSMQVEDSLGNASRWGAVVEVLRESASALAAVAENWDVRPYLFSERATPLAVTNGELELPQAAAGSQSAIGASLDDVLKQEAGQRVLAVVLLSDGAQRAYPPRDLAPQTIARQLAAQNVPLYTVVFGQPGSSGRADLAIADLETNETIFADTPTRVSGTISSEGYANQSVAVRLWWESASGEMEVVDTQTLALANEQEPTRLVFQHVPSTPGEYKVTLRVEPREGELVTTNNQISTFVTVLKGGVRVLYLAGAQQPGGLPFLEQLFVRRALASHLEIAIDYQVLDYSQWDLDFRQQFRPGEYDVVVLDNVDAAALDAASWSALAELVQQGGGLIMLGGHHSFGPGGYAGTPLAAVLPVRMDRTERQNFNEPRREDVHVEGPLAMRPTDRFGRRHPVLQLGGETSTAATWSTLPPLDGANRLLPKPGGAFVLLESDQPARAPLLVAAQVGGGRVLAFAGDSTWRWQLAGYGDELRRFWRQVVLWLARKDQQTGDQVWLKLSGRRFTRGSRVRFAVGVRSADREPVSDATYDVQVVPPDLATRRVIPVRQGQQAVGEIRDTSTTGDYLVRVTASRAGAALGTVEARFTVPEADIELDQPGAERSLMKALAAMTSEAGGEGLQPEQLPSFLTRLSEQQPELEEEVVRRRTYWDHPLLFLLFVGLLSGEWYLRKRWGLV